MAPLGVNKAVPVPAEAQAQKQAAAGTAIPMHVKLFNDVRTRLEVEKQVTFEESGRAFVQAQERLADPETRRFVNDVMVGAVEIFLNQTASNVQPALLIHFEEVLRAAGKIISWEIRTLRSVKHLELLGKLIDDSMPFYLDKRTLIANARRCGSVRSHIVNELVQDGTFDLLLQMLKGQVPILDWSHQDFAPPAGKPQPESAPLTARIMYLTLLTALNARHKDVPLTAFGEACMKEVNRSFVGEGLKRQKAEDVTEMHTVLVQIFGPRDEALHEFSLTLWLRCFEMDAFAVKKLGLDNLIRVCHEAMSNRQPNQRILPGSTSVVPERMPTPLSSWDDIRVCTWLNEKRVLDSLFGSGAQTHSALVGRSKSLLDSMAKAGVLGSGHIDMIFESSVGQHESSRGAVHSLLAELLLDWASSGLNLGLDSPPIIILKRATSLIAKRPEEMYYFARKVMQLESSARNRGIMVSRNADIQKAMLELLWTLAMRTDLSDDDKEAETRADQVLGDFNDALRTAIVPLPTSYTFNKPGEILNEDRIFKEFLTRCEAILNPSDASADDNASSDVPSDAIVWRACAVLKHLIQLHPDVVTLQAESSWMPGDKLRPEWTKRSQVAFVEDLDKRLHLTDWLVERIRATPGDLSDRKAKHRLDFLRFIAERVRAYDCLDLEKIKVCWSSFADRPELRLNWLRELVQNDSTRLPVLSRTVAEQVFSELLCASEMTTLGTESGFECFAAYFYEINREKKGQAQDEVANGASHSVGVPVVGLETLWTLVIYGPQSVEEKAASMLLKIQQLTEALNPESGIGFVERIMTALENSDSDLRRKRCIQLASAYLSSQIILDSHLPATGNLTDSPHDITVHHDDLITFGPEDVGKVMEKRFREKTGFGWYAGLVSEFIAQTSQHNVFFRDGDQKLYDFKSLLRENSPAHVESAAQAAERPLFRMLSIVSDGFAFDTTPLAPSAVNALHKYKGLRIVLSKGMTVADLKTQVLDQLGRRPPALGEADTEFQVELDAPLATVPDYLSLKLNLPASAGGKPLQYVRYRLLNEGLPALLISARFGGKLFLCAKTVEVTPAPVTVVVRPNEVTPASYISRENSPQHALLQRMVQETSLSEETRMGLWNLLMTLPTERGLLSRATSEGFDWGSQLDGAAKNSTVLLQVYLLQIADKLCIDASLNEFEPVRDERAARFAESFFKPEIAARVLALFTRIMSKDFESEWERGVALRVVVRLIKRFVEHRLIPDAQRLSKDLTRLILWDMSLQRLLVGRDTIPTTVALNGSGPSIPPPPPLPALPSSSPGTPGNDDSGDASGRLSLREMDLSLIAIGMEAALVEDPANRRFLLEGVEGSEKSLVDVLLLSPFAVLRESTYRLLLRIAETDEEGVFARVLRALQLMQDYTMTSANFFDFAKEFVVMGSPDRAQERCRGLMGVVRDRLNEYKYSGAGEDPTLNGMLDLCRMLVEHGAGSETEDSKLVRTVLSRYLLAVTSANVASSPGTRQRCFSLLRVLIAHNATNYNILVEEIQGFVEMVSKPLARGGRLWDLNFRAEDTRRPTGTHVGLVNQGATCYQNSVLQQLFMRKEMRELLLRALPGLEASASVLSAALDEDEPSVNSEAEPITKKKAKGKHELLTQLHGLFSFLSCSEQRYFNPRTFVNHSAVLRLTDGHMSQNDCIEFYSLMMEYLEEVFKGRPEREQLRSLFVCSMTSLTMRHCPQKHRSEKEESTFYISLSIRYGPEGRALNSLEEALDEWSKSEHLSDLICEECFPPRSDANKQNSSSSQAGGAGGGAKIDQPAVKQRFDADQVKFITRFPPILVLQLKRFDFDYDTLLPTKLNHRVSFEQRLDLGRFTREAVLRQFEGGQENQEEPHVWYRLKGVVVHQGTGANFGHYYSFIEDDDRKAWFRFDDERVTPFDLSHLEEECFGGPIVMDAKSTSPVYAAAAAAGNKRQGFGGLRNNNGYLLIYTKEDMSDVYSKPPVEPVTATAQALLQQPTLPSKCIRLRTLARIGRLSRMWVTRARLYLDTRRAMREHELSVNKENERALRHAIAFAPDFLLFCLRTLTTVPANLATSEEGLKKTGIFAASAILRIVLFAAAEKERYEHWLVSLKSILRQSPAAESAVCDWILTEINADKMWLERLLLHCLDIRSSALFTELLLHAIGKGQAKLVDALAENMVRVFPRTALEAARYTQADGNYFVVLRALVLARPAVREFLLRKDMVLSLVKLLDETALTAADLEAVHQQQPSQRQPRGSEMSAYTTVVRDEKLCSKVVNTLDALLFGTGEEDEAEDESAGAGFPVLSKEAAKALLAETLLTVLTQFCPRPAKRLIARLCDCSITRYERCIERLVQAIYTSQWPAKVVEAPYIIPDVCEVLEYLFMAIELDVNARALRETYLTQLVKFAKETKRLAAERKEQLASRNVTPYYNTASYGETERQDVHRASVLLITHVGELLTTLALNSDACRSVLKDLKWVWLVQALDVNSFEPTVGGNEACSSRDLTRGRAVRGSLRAAVALGQLPRPTLTPALCTSVLVEEAGSPEVNGWYRFDGFFSPGVSDTVDTVTPKYARVDPTTGKRFTLFRCAATENSFWYISELSDKPGTNSDIDYYQGKDTTTGVPDPAAKWQVLASGIKPAPRVVVRRATIPNPEDNLLEFAAV